MVKSLYLHSLKYGRWSCELEFREKLEVCKLQMWSSPLLALLIDHSNDANTIQPAHLWITYNCSTKECIFGGR